MSLSFGEVIEKSKPIRPLLNVGAGFDIPTGSYRFGKHGESILNGGLAPFTAIVGKGNTFKTAITMYFMGRVLERYNNANALHYDSECTFGTDRILSLMSHLDPGVAQGWLDQERIYLTDDSIAKGNQWFKQTVQGYAGMKQKDRKSMGTLPFVDSQGNLIPYLYPTVNAADSMSEMKFDDLEKNYAKMEIGQGEMQTEAMRVSNAKRMLIEKTQGYANAGGLYVLMTAHLGKELNMDGKPQEKKTTFMKQGDKISKVPSQILSLPNNAWEISTGTPLIVRETKEWMYPKPGRNDIDTNGNPDLITLVAKNLRGKNGPSGVPWEFVMSQSEGLLPSLTEFNHIKNCNRYGLGGNDRNYYVELLPDLKLMRTTVRGKIDETPELRRALEITMEMCQMRFLWHTRDPKYNMTPEELRVGLEQKGYKWDQLLNTRGFWTYEEDNHPLPFLSTMDLLRMYHDEYRPYWL